MDEERKETVKCPLCSEDDIAFDMLLTHLFDQHKLAEKLKWIEQKMKEEGRRFR